MDYYDDIPSTLIAYNETNKKRLREEDEEEKLSRKNYRCKRCDLPKKGHVCPYQPRLKDKASGIEVKDEETQTELNPNETIRLLNISVQGTIESYLHVINISQDTNYD